MKSLVLVFMAAAGLWAQQVTQSPTDIVISVGAPTVGGPMTVSLLGDMFSAAVTGAPYSADGVTETTQFQPDGNRTVTKSTTRIYRDIEGRERKEAIAGGRATSITISDPVLRVTYTLDPATKTATKKSAGPQAAIKGGMVGEGFTSPAPSPAEKSEDLGQRVIEQLPANGTRITTGSTMTESWFSPDLKVVVMSKRTSPQGEVTYRLVNVSRISPPPSLFEVPSEYQIKPQR
jgi:hypothetical protein